MKIYLTIISYPQPVRTEASKKPKKYWANPYKGSTLSHMNGFIFTLMLVAMGLTLLSLIAGIFVMAKGGKINEMYANKLMRARVYSQGFALALFAIAFLMNQTA